VRIVIEFNSKELGVVITPPQTVEYIISKLGEIKDEQKILDPCVGPGIFIKKLIESGVGKISYLLMILIQVFKKKLKNWELFLKGKIHL